MRSFRSKPVGWQRDNYRHYLAAKGVSTKKSSFMAKKLPTITDGYYAVEEDMKESWGDRSPDDETQDIRSFKDDVSKQVAHPMRDLDERYASMVRAKGKEYVSPESMQEKFEDRMAASLASVATLGSAECLINPKRESEKPARQQMVDLMLGNAPGE